MLRQSDEGTAYAARRLLGELRLGANIGFVPVLRKSTLGALGGGETGVSIIEVLCVMSPKDAAVLCWLTR